MTTPASCRTSRVPTLLLSGDTDQLVTGLPRKPSSKRSRTPCLTVYSGPGTPRGGTSLTGSLRTSHRSRSPAPLARGDPLVRLGSGREVAGQSADLLDEGGVGIGKRFLEGPPKPARASTTAAVDHGERCVSGW